MAKLTINPLTGLWNIGDDAAKTAETAAKSSRVVVEYDCDASLAIHKPVHLDSGTSNKVLESTLNTNPDLSIGIVISKPTPTTCEVLILGIEEGFSGLSIGSRQYLGETGGLTEVAPTAGYQQVMGTAVNVDTIFFVPNNMRVFKS